MKTTTKKPTNSIPSRPNPLRVMRDENEVEEDLRRRHCNKYGRCLTVAAIRNWDGFTCEGCTAYQPNDHETERFERLCMLACLADLIHGPGTADAALTSLSYDHVFPHGFANDPMVESFRMRLDERAAWFAGAEFDEHEKARRATVAKAQKLREERELAAIEAARYEDEGAAQRLAAVGLPLLHAIERTLQRAVAEGMAA